MAKKAANFDVNRSDVSRVITYKDAMEMNGKINAANVLQAASSLGKTVGQFMADAITEAALLQISNAAKKGQI